MGDNKLISFCRDFIRDEEADMDHEDRVMVLRMIMMENKDMVSEVESGTIVNIDKINDAELLRNITIMICNRRGLDPNVLLSQPEEVHL